MRVKREREVSWFVYSLVVVYELMVKFCHAVKLMVNPTKPMVDLNGL